MLMALQLAVLLLPSSTLDLLAYSNHLSPRTGYRGPGR